MAARVEELISGQEPVTIEMDSPVTAAFGLMVANDFSQLPIVDEAGKQLGIVTAEGILKSQQNFGASLKELRVRHASASAPLASPGDDVFDVFNQFEQHSAVLVVDNQAKLLGIITPWDTAAYLQRRAEDLMLVEDVESMLKEHIVAAYTKHGNGRDEDALNTGIRRIVDRSDRNYKAIAKALNQYINRNSIDHRASRERIEESFAEVIFNSGEEKSFDELTFHQLTELLLHKSIWNEYGQMFTIEASRVRKLLDEVRESRNKLAHFRGDLTEAERDRVRFCRDWLERYPVREFGQTARTATDGSRTADPACELNLIPAEDEIAPNESRYAKLAVYLQQLPMKERKRSLTFGEVEEILEGELPESAWNHRSWWANDSVSHIQSKQWLEAGWRVASINMSEHRVTFTRIEEREEMYIRFFGQLLDKLRTTDFPLRDVNPAGTNWIYVDTLPKDQSGQYALFAYAFSRSQRFRVELYIDALDQEKNHKIFNLLASQKEEIESDLGHELSWQKLEDRRACRIAIYRDGSITGSEAELDELSTWATETMLKFEGALGIRATQAINKTLSA